MQEQERRRVHSFRDYNGNHFMRWIIQWLTKGDYGTKNASYNNGVSSVINTALDVIRNSILNIWWYFILTFLNKIMFHSESIVKKWKK